MSSFLTLLRLSVVNHFGLTAMRVKYLRKREKLWEPLVIGFAILSLASTLGTGVFFVARGIVSAAPSGQADMGLTIPILITQVIALFTGLFTLISLFYFSNDLDILVPLPFKEKAILGSKFALATITEYFFSLFIIIPALFAYNQYLPLGIAGWIVTAVVFILLPIAPLAISGVLVVTVMRGLNRRHRDALIVIASLVLLAAIMYVQYAFQSAVISELDIDAVLQNRVDLVRLLGSAFPPSVWATRAISRAGEIEGLINLVYLLTISILGTLVFLTVGQKVFYGGLIGGAEHVRKNLAFTQRVLAKQATATPVLKALYLREWKLFIRVPIWVLNGFIAVVIVPLLAFFPAFTGGQGLDQLGEWAKTSPNGLAASTLIFAGLIAALASLNTLASTSVSREGKHLWISKIIPVEPRQQVLAKLVHAAIASAIITVPISGLFYYLINPPIAYLIVAATLGITAGATPQIIGLIFDMWQPFLTWSNPQHAVKNNLNSVFPLLALLPLGLVTYLSFKALSGVFESLGVVLTLTAAHVLLASISLTVLMRAADTLYNRLEVKG